jgi:hypothetical protein
VNPLLAMSEPYSEVLAACSSMCIGSGSLFSVYSLISASLTKHSIPHWNRPFLPILEVKDVGAACGHIARSYIPFLNASHAARCVACHGVRSHAVPVALVGECSSPIVCRTSPRQPRSS